METALWVIAFAALANVYLCVYDSLIYRRSLHATIDHLKATILANSESTRNWQLSANAYQEQGLEYRAEVLRLQSLLDKKPDGQ